MDESEKFKRPADEDEDVEGHKYLQDEEKHEKHETPAEDEDDVEAHKF